MNHSLENISEEVEISIPGDVLLVNVSEEVEISIPGDHVTGQLLAKRLLLSPS